MDIYDNSFSNSSSSPSSSDAIGFDSTFDELEVVSSKSLKCYSSQTDPKLAPNPDTKTLGKLSNIPEVAGSGTSGSALTCGFGKFGTAFDDKCFVAGCFDDAFGVGRGGWTDGPADSSDSLSESRTSFGSSPDIDSIKSFHLKQCLNNVS